MCEFYGTNETKGMNSKATPNALDNPYGSLNKVSKRVACWYTNPLVWILSGAPFIGFVACLISGASPSITYGLLGLSLAILIASALFQTFRKTKVQLHLEQFETKVA